MRPFRLARSSAAAAALLLVAFPAFADVKDGVDAWQAGDFQKAVAEWRPLALAGDADAQFNMGQAYKLGRGVSADLTQAAEWYRRAAKQGHLQAEDNLGLLLFTQDRRVEAMPMIQRSAARGEPRAQYVLGTAMFNGELVTKDWPRAYALTKSASDAGLAVASARLAQLDQLIPLDQRQIGLALLPQMEKDAARTRLAAIGTAPLAEPPPAAAPPVQTAAAATVALPVPAVSRPAPPAKADAKPAQPPATHPPTTKPSATKPPAAKATPTRVVATGPWRAQLGAFAVEANAKSLWRKLAGQYAAVAARSPSYVKAGAVTRLHAAGFASRGDAEAFCAPLRRGGHACLVVDR